MSVPRWLAEDALRDIDAALSDARSYSMVQMDDGQPGADMVVIDIILRLEGASDHLKAHLKRLAQTQSVTDGAP
jgi:hypothetical protein